MDTAPTKWKVTFTNHLNRKRKVYRDGFLSLHPSTAKVMLYDDSDQLLECGILKDDGVVSSGETLTFNAYLVDVGEPEGGQKPLHDTYSHSREKKVPMRINSLHRNKFVNVFDCTGDVKTKVEKAKPVAENYKRRVRTQGHQVRQVFLYDMSWKLLDGRFLNKAEEVSPGEMMEFPGHLVEVGNSEANACGNSFNSLHKLNMQKQQHNVTTIKSAGKAALQLMLLGDTPYSPISHCNV